MTKRAVVRQFDHLLKPRSFLRQKDVWNRRVQSIVDVIDIQISKVDDSATVNAGVLDREVYTIAWGREPPELIEQPHCTIGVRIGALRDDRLDKWWRLGDDNSVADLVGNVEAHVLPFLEYMHTREAMKQWLIETEVTRKRYPLPIISLAILECLSGDFAQGCKLLAEIQARSRSAGGWGTRAAEVAERLGCFHEGRGRSTC